jgi:DNA-binding GntR family transcriptional regulator
MPTRPRRSLSEQVYERLRTLILERRLPPETKLDINALSAELGVSRMPILEALTRLKHERLVMSKNRVGTYVMPLDRTTLIETFEARRMIEDWIAPRSIMHLRDTDVLALRDMLAHASQLFVDVNDDTFDYRAYIEYDTEFHLSLVKLCGNSAVVNFYVSLNSHMQIARAYALRALSRSRAGHEEHRLILEAFAARDVEQAREAQRQHLESSTNGVLALIEQHGAL